MNANRFGDWLDSAIFLFKLIGLWPGKDPKISYVLLNMIGPVGGLVIVFNALFAFHLLNYETFELKPLMNDGILIFSDVTVIAKVAMMLAYKDKIFQLFDILDSESFQPTQEEKLKFDSFKILFKRCYNAYFATSLIAASCHIYWPVISHFVYSSELFPPAVAAYNFLSSEFSAKYLGLIYFYQSAGIYMHLFVNVSADGFLSGLLLLAILQVSMLNGRLSNLKNHDEMPEEDVLEHFKQHIRHFQAIESFMNIMNEAFSAMLFVQLSMTSFIICFALLGFLLPGSTNYNSVTLCLFLSAMVIEIMAPCWLGTYLIYESEELAFATYSGDWIPRSRAFKKIMILFITRAQKPFTINGWKIFTVSLDTFTRIIKSAYSFFTVLQNMQLN